MKDSDARLPHKRIAARVEYRKHNNSARAPGKKNTAARRKTNGKVISLNGHWLRIEPHPMT